MKEAILYELIDKFEYANKGEIQEASFIELRPPTAKNMKECSELKQSFFQALPRTDSKNEVVLDDSKSEDTGMTGSEIMMILNMSDTIKLCNVMVNSKILLTSGLAMIEGEQKLTRDIFDKMSMDDVENMTGEYLANFILASSLTAMKNL